MKGFKTTAGVTVEAAAGTDEMSNSRPPIPDLKPWPRLGAAVVRPVLRSSRRLRGAQRRRLNGAAPRDAGKLGTLEHQRIDRNQCRAAGHGKSGNLRAEQEGVEDTCRQRKCDDVVADRPPEVLMHLAQRGMGQLDGADHVVGIALHQNHVGALDSDVGAGADGEADIRLRERRRVVDAVANHADLLALHL